MGRLPRRAGHRPGGCCRAGRGVSGGVAFDPAHLWFLYVLLLFSNALLPLLLYLRRPRGARLERLVYLFPLLYGYLIASERRFETALLRGRRPALAGALVATAVLMLWAAALSRSGVDVMTGAAPGWSGLQGLAGWLWVVAIVGLAESLMARRQRRSPSTAALPAARLESRWRRAAGYANQAVLPFYLLHEPVIVAAAWVIVRWRAPIPMKYAVLVVVSFAGTLLLYDVLVRRLRVTRLLFGMRALATPQA